jgi:Vault protein inter-alpha-trypsin domain
MRHTEFIINQQDLVSARVTFTQVYNNPLDRTTGRCKYCFPVPAGATICAFGMTTSDGRTVTGIAKDKDKAREEYKEALDAGKSAGILEYVTDDS